jgi:acetoin utilization deacetylase AcuC-like enzyme
LALRVVGENLPPLASFDVSGQWPVYLAAAWPNEGSICKVTILSEWTFVKKLIQNCKVCFGLVRGNLTQLRFFEQRFFHPCALTQHPVSLTELPAAIPLLNPPVSALAPASPGKFMKIFYSDAHLQHNPPFEIFDGGEKVPNFEVPERAERILAALKATRWAEILPPEDFGIDPILAIHAADYIAFLRSAFDEWLSAATDTDYAKSALLPATFPPGGWRKHVPQSLLGKAGYYMMDLSAPIVAGTYAAALASANCALSGAKAISTSVYPLQNPLPASAFALCRPPGHHAGRANCGGYCYINNAAVAANWLSAHGKTALLDIDYHAGNGTQDIFYARGDVLTISIHADPNFEYPYYAGYADETGVGAGFGYHRNFPLPLGADDSLYNSALSEALGLIKAFGAQYLVVSAGMDLYGGDPLGKVKVSRDGIRQIGKTIAALNRSTLIVMEGGYNNAALGENMVTFLEDFA